MKNKKLKSEEHIQKVSDTFFNLMMDNMKLQVVPMFQKPRGKEKLKKAVVFDLDSTLCDCSWRIKYAVDKNWDTFHSGCALDTSITNNILLAKLLQEEGYELLIFTGRTEKYRGDTNQWLSARGIYSDHIAMRSDYNRAQAKDLKLGFLRSFKKLGYDVQMIFDDDKSVRDHLSSHGYLVINSNL
jgi:phosphoglycolate phosphatase-like HAD superfamily hydrolase